MAIHWLSANCGISHPCETQAEIQPDGILKMEK
jgi:hypothetical protein